eukprot:CAMPEP_0113587516 /NCGR_PEP_ID=MMETSP0015_2-20120614/34951_1 /TAXON_ID=2838 /ORGANISM="Odontella" /LENGTH=55 /DNA_ID=CAMNT_0000493183 /DNA_START=118 /DNA_END=282 /DNA_ORIENTATION=+ /assembly_acc=CAM_ASM_000160
MVSKGALRMASARAPAASACGHGAHGECSSSAIFSDKDLCQQKSEPSTQSKIHLQ